MAGNADSGVGCPGGLDRVVGQGRFLRLVDRGGWEFVERIVGKAVITVVALTPEGRLVLVEQFRPALGTRVIELPAGLVGDEAGGELEAMAQAVRRELLEETGYEAGQIEFLTEGPTSAGLTSEQVAFFLATGLRRVSQGGGTGSEDILVHEVSLAGAEAWLKQRERTGVRVDPKVFAGLYFAASQ